ncbi:MAG: hypothetical protein AAB516_01850 [Patescibacteria group bacterium]
MDENIKQQNFSTGENTGSVPPPPAPAIGIRTMKSDLESIRQSGGEAPAPQTFIPSELKQEMPQPAVEEPKIEAALNIPGYTGPEKPIFEPQQSVSTSQPAPPPPVQPSIQPTPQPTQTSTTTPQATKSSALKITLLIICAILVVIGLGLLGYYVISPLIFKK